MSYSAGKPLSVSVAPPSGDRLHAILVAGGEVQVGDTITIDGGARIGSPAWNAAQAVLNERARAVADALHTPGIAAGEDPGRA